MCILPNFEPQDLQELERKGKKGTKRAEAEAAVEMVVAEQSLEKPI